MIVYTKILVFCPSINSLLLHNAFIYKYWNIPNILKKAKIYPLMINIWFLRIKFEDIIALDFYNDFFI
jgi:hypothetical protein